MCKFLTQADDLAIANLRARMYDIMRAQYKIRDLITKKLDLDVWQRVNKNKL